MANTTNTTKLNPSSGLHVATRGASGALDTWQEYLYAHPGDGGVLLSVWAHQVIGDVPGGWYDEDGELLPMHRTADGELRLPEVFAGQQVVDFMDGMFVGDLEQISDAVHVEDAEHDTVRLALGELEWTLGDAEDVRVAVDQLQGSTGTAAPTTTTSAEAAIPLMVSFWSIVRGHAAARQQGSPWRRVVNRGGLIYWLGGEDEEGE